METRVRDTKKILAVCSLFAWISLLIAVIVLFNAQWQQIYYWDYQPWLWGLPAGFYIVIGVAIAFIITFVMFAPTWWKWFHSKYVRGFWNWFSVLAFIIMLAGATTVFSFASTYFPTSYYNDGPYLTWATGQDPTNSITVCWHSALYGGSEVMYGTEPNNLSFHATSSDFGLIHRVPLSHLQPNTTYYYQVWVFPIKQFTTAPKGNFTYTFCAWSDPRTNDGGFNDPEILNDQPNLPLIMSQQLAANGTNMAFSICCGDIVDFGVDYASWRLWLDDISSNDFACNHSNAITVGNHERHEDPTGRNMAAYYPYTQDAQNAFYYSFTYGNTHFVMLDPLNPLYNGTANNWWAMTPTEESWLKADLQAHMNDTFRVICVHPSAFYEHQPSDQPTTNPIDGGLDGNIYNTLVPITQEYNVSVVFSGHMHHYEVDHVNSTLFMDIGIGGNTDFGMSNSGYVQVTVNATAMLIKSRYTNGMWFDSHLISAK